MRINTVLPLAKMWYDVFYEKKRENIAGFPQQPEAKGMGSW